MAHTYDPTTNRGTVRLLLDDTTTGSWTYTDAEIDRFLSLASDNIPKALEYGWRQVAASFKKLLTCRFFGEVYTDPSSARKAALEMARDYAQMAMADAGMQITQLQQRIDIYGRDKTDYNNASAKTLSDFEDYEVDQWNNL